MRGILIPIILAFVAGAFVPIQTGANALLSRGLGSSMLSTLVVFLVATITTTVFLLFQRPAIPPIAEIGSIPLFSWILGGVLGSIYIVLLIYTAPRLGMASVVGLVVLGQIFMAMFVDHYGWLGMDIHHFNWKRLAGALMMILGLVIIKKN